MFKALLLVAALVAQPSYADPIRLCSLYTDMLSEYMSMKIKGATRKEAVELVLAVPRSRLEDPGYALLVVIVDSMFADITIEDVVSSKEELKSIYYYGCLERY